MRHEKTIYYTCDLCDGQCSSGSSILLQSDVPELETKLTLHVPSSDCGNFSDARPDLCNKCLAEVLHSIADSIANQQGED